MADGVPKGVQRYVFGHSEQLWLYKFFDKSIPSMRNVDDGEKKKKKRKEEKKNGENSGPLTSLPVIRLNGDRLQRRPLVPKVGSPKI